MKRILIPLAVILTVSACKMGTPKSSDKVAAVELDKSQQALHDSSNFTTIEWLDSTFIDMGKVNKGEKLNVVFRFKNTGSKPLIIANVSAQCGCTIPETPKEPFEPGATGEIKAVFNSGGQTPGPHRKAVYVTANTSPTTYNVLEFNADVVEK